MVMPTREELERLACEAEEWAEVFAGEGTDQNQEGLTRIAALLRAYPLPAEDGERARASQDLYFACNDLRMYGARGITAALSAMDRAAALLLQPVAGVSRGAVLLVLRRHDLATLSDIIAAVRALPEAKPKPEGRGAREMAEHACECSYQGGYRPVPLPGERLFCRLCGGEIVASPGRAEEEGPTGARLLRMLPEITDPALCAALAEAAGEPPLPAEDGERARIAKTVKVTADLAAEHAEELRRAQESPRHRSNHHL